MYHFKNPGELKGTISNLNAFLHRDLNSGFSTKWSGLWTPSQKLLDYYSYRINGIWLDTERLQAVDYGDEITYYFETDSLEIKETISMPDNLSGLKSRLQITNKKKEKKAVHIGLEAGIDIRNKTEDIGPEDYGVEISDTVKASSKEVEIIIDSDRELLTSGEPYIRDHFPGERQKCLVPGEISSRMELGPEETAEAEFRFYSGESTEIEINNHGSKLEGDLGRSFTCSIDSMLNLMYDREGLGLIAGHPWFQNYWARDSFWTLLGLIDAGYFEEAEKILENFATNGLPGKIELNGENPAETREDTYPLFIIAADKLRRHHEISDTIREGMEQAFNQLETKDGVVKHDPSGTWMDTLTREQAVDVQALWLKASEIMGENRNLEKGLEKFKSPDYMKDHLGENPPATINPAVGLMYGYFDEEVLSKINAEFSSRHGARTRAVTDPGYESAGYHTGSAWGLTTCWAAAANFQHGKAVEGLNFLNKLEKHLDSGQPGALPELVDSENGENLGCVEQAWSAGMMVHVIDSYLLGIEVTEDKVIIDPCKEYSGKRLQKRVGDEYIDFSVENGEVEILNDPEIDRELIT